MNTKNIKLNLVILPVLFLSLLGAKEDQMPATNKLAPATSQQGMREYPKRIFFKELGETESIYVLESEPTHEIMQIKAEKTGEVFENEIDVVKYTMYYGFQGKMTSVWERTSRKPHGVVFHPNTSGSNNGYEFFDVKIFNPDSVVVLYLAHGLVNVSVSNTDRNVFAGEITLVVNTPGREIIKSGQITGTIKENSLAIELEDTVRNSKRIFKISQQNGKLVANEGE